MTNTVAEATAILWFGQATIALLVGTVYMLQPDWYEWYSQLRKAPFNPPNYVFGIAWTILYMLFATSGFLAFRRLGDNEPALYWGGIVLFEILLAMLAVWPFVFFHLRLIRLGLLIVGLSALASIGCVVIAWLLNVVAGALLIPMPLWLLFAFALNLYITMSTHVEGDGGGIAMMSMSETKEAKSPLTPTMA